MSADDSFDPEGDPFHPPAVPTDVQCLHCGRDYESYLIEWRIEEGADGKKHGFWCCPTPGCDGKGFGFDIFPTDPEYRDERGGWVDDGYDEGAGEGDEFIPEGEEEWTPEDNDAAIDAGIEAVEQFDAEKEMSEILKDIDESDESDDDEDAGDETDKPF